MNKKGFAISIILYSIVFLIITILYMLLGIVRNRYVINEKLRENVLDELNQGEDYTGPFVDPWEDVPEDTCTWGEWTPSAGDVFTNNADCTAVLPSDTDVTRYKCDAYVNCYTVTCHGLCDGVTVGGTDSCMNIDNPAHNCKNVYCPTGNFTLSDFNYGEAHYLYRVYERKCS